jgi:hypothetical protein
MVQGNSRDFAISIIKKTGYESGAGRRNTLQEHNAADNGSSAGWVRSLAAPFRPQDFGPGSDLPL